MQAEPAAEEDAADVDVDKLVRRRAAPHAPRTVRDLARPPAQAEAFQTEADKLCEHAHVKAVTQQARAACLPLLPPPPA